MPPEELPKSNLNERLLRGRPDDDSAQQLSQSLLIEMQLSSQRERLNETTSTRIMRAADVLVGGAVQGTYEHGKLALTDPASLVKFGSSAVLATGLTMAQSRAGLIKLSAQVGSLALAGAFAKDLYGKGEETAAIMKDTWNTPENKEANKQAIGNTLGPFVVDFGIFSAGGAAGIGTGKFASKKFFGAETPSRALRLEPEVAGLSRTKATGSSTVEPAALIEKPGLLSREPNVVGSSSSAMVARPLSKSVYVEGTSAKPPAGLRGETVSATPRVNGAAEGRTMPSSATVEIPVVELGAHGVKVQKFPAESPLAQTFESASQSLGKIEVVSVKGETVQARTATAVSLGEGKLVTNHHVVENASDITIFDPLGRPHKAHAVVLDRTSDLAIVQLKDRNSFSAFLDARFKNRDGYKAPEETTVVAIGHFDSSNKLTASPGVIPHDMRQTPLDLAFNGSVMNGNSGGALFAMDGTVIGIVKSGFPNGKGIASPSWQIDRVARSGEKVAPPKPLSKSIQEVTTFSVDNVVAAKANVAKLFDTAMEGVKPPEFFHSKIKRVELQVPGSKARQLVLQTQISPSSREIHVQPISFGGEPISPTVMWPGTSVPMGTSRLTLRFEPGLGKAEMHSVNDPLGILPNGFNYRSEGNYLASLAPTTKLSAAAKELPQRLH